MLAEHVADPRASAALATLWPYLGLPPSRASFLYFATLLLSYVADGACYCRGTFQALADQLAGAVEAAGGEVLLRAEVRRILVEGGRARGVVLENGQRIAAPAVVSNADLRQTALELVGREHFGSRWLERLGRLEPSVSAFVVYGATSLDLRGAGLAHETFRFPGLRSRGGLRPRPGRRPGLADAHGPDSRRPGPRAARRAPLRGDDPARLRAPRALAPRQGARSPSSSSR